MTDDEPRFLTTLRDAQYRLLRLGLFAQAECVEDCIDTFIVAWKTGDVVRTMDGRYRWGLHAPKGGPGV